MLILDLNQVIISNIMAQIGSHTNVPIEIGLVRHMVLNQLRTLRNRFKGKYGDDIVIATDGRHYWRRDIFPHYKANRAKSRKQSDFDWSSLFNCLNQLRDELKENMPYPVIYHDRAEADDIIATVVMMGEGREKVLILSGDGDFVQLQRYTNVDQYDPIRDRFVKTDDPYKYLREHILKGDSGDGIPNILSPEDTFVSGKRQKKVTEKFLGEWMDKDDSLITDSRFHQNRQLIDLSFVPQWLQEEIIKELNNQKDKSRDKMFNYFVSARLKLLLEHIQEF